jgi:hypothetical protein
LANIDQRPVDVAHGERGAASAPGEALFLTGAEADAQRIQADAERIQADAERIRQLEAELARRQG